MTTLPDDPALIDRAQRDPEAFAELYRGYLTPVYRYLYRRLGNAHEAEDITSQVFMDALEAGWRGWPICARLQALLGHPGGSQRYSD